MTESYRDRLVWPDPKVPPVDRARAMALAYREAAIAAQARLDAARKALASVDLRVLRFADPDAAKTVRELLAEPAPDPVAALDVQFSEWGERWHAPAPEFTFDDDDWVPTVIAVGIARLRNNTLGEHRIKGRIRGRRIKLGPANTFMYRVGDLRALRAARGAGGRRPGNRVEYE